MRFGLKFENYAYLPCTRVRRCCGSDCRVSTPSDTVAACSETRCGVRSDREWRAAL